MSSEKRLRCFKLQDKEKNKYRRHGMVSTFTRGRSMVLVVHVEEVLLSLFSKSQIQT